MYSLIFSTVALKWLIHFSESSSYVAGRPFKGSYLLARAVIALVGRDKLGSFDSLDPFL